MAIFRKKKKVMMFFNPVTGEEIDKDIDKPYLLLLKDLNSEKDDGGQWYPFRGRQTVFDFMYSQLGNWDLLESYVMSGSMRLGQEISLYTFMRYCITNKKVEQDKGEPLTLDELNNMVLMSMGEDFDQDMDTFTNQLDKRFVDELNQRIK